MMDYESLISEQDMVCDKLPEKWSEGLFTGNGQIGVMAFFDWKRNALNLELGCTEITDNQTDSGSVCFDKARLPIGRILWHPDGRVKSGKMRLSLWNAEISGTLQTDRGEEHFVIRTLARPSVSVLEISGGRIEFEAESAVSPRVNFYPPPTEYKAHPPPELRSDGVIQRLLCGKYYQTVFQPFQYGYFISSGWNEDARIQINAAQQRPYDDLIAIHRSLYHEYYRQSAVMLPDSRLEQFYWIQVYKMFAANYNTQNVVDLQGPWPYHTPWPLIWWNLNIQLTYYPFFTANRLEFGRKFFNFMFDHLDAFRANVPPEYQHDSIGIGRASSYDCLSPVGTEKGNLLWGLHLCYRYYRCSLDESLIAPLVKMLRLAVGYYRHILERHADGLLHLPETFSPEYGPAEDCNYDLALLKWGCQTLMELAPEPEYQQIMEELTPFPVDENGYMVGANVPFSQSHRHYSHLLMFCPLHLVPADNTVRKSLDHWLSLKSNHFGYTYTGAASMFAYYGEGKRSRDMLYNLLNFMEEHGQLNTMYQETGPVIETPLSALESVHDMLLQSYDGAIKIFPAVPGDWKDVSFENLRGDGAFLVSARRRNGRTERISITSLAGAPCKIICDKFTEPVIIPLKKGESISL